jgi:hypothetical protein
VHLDDLRVPGELDARVGQDRHQVLAVGLLENARGPATPGPSIEHLADGAYATVTPLL